MFWTKSILPNVIQDIILLAKFMLDKNTSDKPLLDKMILDEVLFSLNVERNHPCVKNLHCVALRSIYSLKVAQS